MTNNPTVKAYLNTFGFSVTACLCLAYLAKIVLLKHDTNLTKNKLTLAPYYVVFVFLVILALTDLAQEANEWVMS
jgi:hypothetical protein